MEHPRPSPDARLWREISAPDINKPEVLICVQRFKEFLCVLLPELFLELNPMLMQLYLLLSFNCII